MSFFSERPAHPLPEPAPPGRWPPENLLPGVLAFEAILGHSYAAAVAVGRPRCYPSGFALTLLVRLRESPLSHDVRSPDGHIPLDTTRFPMSFRSGFRPGMGATESHLPDDVLRVGVIFPDGRSVTSLDADGIGTGGEISLSISGGGGLRTWNYLLWLSPLPPPGRISLLCEWPAKGIAQGGSKMEADAIIEAARRAVDRPTFLA